MTVHQVCTATGWPCAIAESWDAFVREVRTFAQPRIDPNTGQAAEWNFQLFRGQPCIGSAERPYGLTTNLSRLLKAMPTMSAGEGYRLIEQSIRKFNREIGLHDNKIHLPTGQVSRESWEAMQHYGAPTPLLDWSASPYVAAYFAVEKDFQENTGIDGVVWMVDYRWVSDRFAETSANDALLFQVEWQAGITPRLTFFRPKKPDRRMLAQQGWFSYCEHVTSDHAKTIHDVCADHGNDRRYKKIVIPRDQKNLFLSELRGMNITASSLFPGPDGLGRSITEMIRLRQPEE